MPPGDILDAVAPYPDSRTHLLDEMAVIRHAAVKHIELGADQIFDNAPPPNPAVVARRVELSIASGIDLRLPLVEETFGLSRFERGVLVLALAAEFDPLFRAITRGLQGELTGPTLQVGTINELLSKTLGEALDLALHFLPDSRLRRNALVSAEDPIPPRDVPMQALRVKIDRPMALFLLGEMPSSAPAWIKIVEPVAELKRARLPEQKLAELERYLRTALEDRRRLLIEMTGPVGAGRKYLAEALCRELGLNLCVIDCREFSTDRENLAIRLGEARREALLGRALPYLDYYDALLNKHESVRGGGGGGDPEQQSQLVNASPSLTLPSELQKFLTGMDLVFLGAEQRFEPLDAAGEVLRVEVPFPTPQQRAEIWRTVLREEKAKFGPDVDLVEIGRKFALDARKIHSAARSSVSLAQMKHEGKGPVVVTRADMLDASKLQLQHDLKSLAVRVDKAYRWEDLVISVDGYHSLLEMISYVQNAEKVYDSWGFAHRHSVAQGISALFSGPPGTGKTMCASVIARELDMELFRVDLSRVVSKWIGETEKNLARVFDEAEKSHAVILFDEADSLFAKRTEVKSSVDRYANLEVNFLLQRMETFSGITVLTTNFEDTIDSAFKRRLTFRIRFDKPDAEARAALWQKMFPPEAEIDPSVNWEELGRRFEVSGGNIRNAAIRAAFLAASEQKPIDMDTIIKATIREAREMGVLIADPIEGDTEFVGMETPPPAQATPGSLSEPAPPQRRRPKLVPITRPRDR